MLHRHSYAAGQARLAWRLFLVSAILNALLATGIAACGCYGVFLNNPTYIAADSRLHFTGMKRLAHVDESSLMLVGNLYKGETDGPVPEEKGGGKAEEEGSAPEKE